MLSRVGGSGAACSSSELRQGLPGKRARSCRTRARRLSSVMFGEVSAYHIVATTASSALRSLKIAERARESSSASRAASRASSSCRRQASSPGAAASLRSCSSTPYPISR